MTENSLAPIILFVYNRADHARRTLMALRENKLAKESDLFIFCDGPRNEDGLLKVKEVHKVVNEISGFKKIVIEKRDLNCGLAKSVIAGVSEILDQYGKAIILEDDIVTAPNFLEFMNDALNFYQNDSEIFLVTGFNFPPNLKKFPANYHEDIFFVKGRNCSWGWAIWKDRWDKIDFEVKDYAEFKNDKKKQKEFNRAGSNLSIMLKMQMEKKIDAWDVQVAYTMFKNNSYTVFPSKTLVKNIGFDQSGIHCEQNKKMMDFDLMAEKEKLTLKHRNEIKDNHLAEDFYISFHKDPFFKFLHSRKKRLRIKYILIGVILGQLINLLFHL